ncbi:acyltransferase family protein [Rubinisphaera margarita]|uniref:acyltransferase family protein n=1 Tax=Rubinisphaera margarita TaxID=2909586 RepID=UPI001EE9796B|nr:hypothetical protein [Rubinisphaera margarita]MCG6156089.1 hypothetical protein [Rubinisphaera margarita]
MQDCKAEAIFRLCFFYARIPFLELAIPFRNGCSKPLHCGGLAPVLTFALLVGVHALPETFHYSVGFTIESLLMGLLMIQLVMLSNRGCWKWLDWKPIRFLGVLSYSMYLYHAWGLAAGRRIGTGSLPLEVFAGVGFTILLACGSYYCVEVPFQKLRDQWEPWIAADRRHQPAAVASTT